MKGYWHVVALAVVMSFLTIVLDTYIFFMGYLCWILYLFFTERLRMLPFLLSLTFYLFFLTYIPHIPPAPTDDSLVAVQSIEGEIVHPPSFTPTKIDFTLKMNNTDDYIKVYYFHDKPSKEHQDDFSSLKYGAICQITGKAELPERSRNPGQFDFQNHLLSQGISYQLIIENMDNIHCEGRKILDVIYSLRLNLIEFVTDRMSDETAGWLNALVLGDDSQLDSGVIDLFQRWGLSHILAISGLHVGLISALIYFLLVKLNVVTKETAQWFMIFFLPIYAFLAGGAPSVLRASLMGLIFLLLSKKRIKYSLTDVLSVIFICLILADQLIVYQIGFQFSFLVTFGLILSRHWLFQTKSPVWQVLKISFVAQMMITPLQLIYFSTFHPLSILVNSLVVPYFSLFVIPAMFLLFIFSPLLPVFVKVFDFIFSYLQHVVLQLLYFIDHYFYFPWIIGELPLLFVILYYVLFLFMMMFLERDKLKNAFYYGVSIVLLFTILILQPYFSPVGYVTMLDIGQGDTFVIELPYRKGVFFMDAGATMSYQTNETSRRIYDQIIKPYLQHRGIMEIDAIFLSHDHLDHDGSVPFIVEDMKVGKIIISDFYEFAEDALEMITSNDVAIHQVQYDDEILLAGQKFHVLSPQIDQYDENENSLVLQTTLGGKSWLFTGDIGKEEERELIKHDHLTVDVLKVAHHGSNTSTDESFIKQINPDYALISVGENNRYDHPSSDVISRLENENIVILRTDQDGAVQFRFKKDEGTFFKYLRIHK